MTTSSQLYAEDARLLAEITRQGAAWVRSNVRTEAEAQDVLQTLYRIDKTIFWALPKSSFDGVAMPWAISERRPGLWTMSVESLQPSAQRGAFRQLCVDYPRTLCETFPGIKPEGLNQMGC